METIRNSITFSFSKVYNSNLCFAPKTIVKRLQVKFVILVISFTFKTYGKLSCIYVLPLNIAREKGGAKHFGPKSDF